MLASKDRWKVDFFRVSELSPITPTFDSIRLGNIVVEGRDSINPQSHPNDAFHYIGLENIQTLTGDVIGETRVLGKQVRSRSKVFRANNILYGRLRPYLNKVYLAQEPIAEGICSGEFYVLKPDYGKVMPNYLRAILASNYIQSHVGKWQTGSALPRLQLDDLLGIEIPLPPLSFQQQLDDLIVGEDKRRRTLQAELEKLPMEMAHQLTSALESGHM
ncbi:MAG: restriction endonuclease subunit S [Chloroflexi bacterium]|nr:restriction endonuclease subunit S [Chloroflexota bacterium]